MIQILDILTKHGEIFQIQNFVKNEICFQNWLAIIQSFVVPSDLLKLAQQNKGKADNFPCKSIFYLVSSTWFLQVILACPTVDHCIDEIYTCFRNRDENLFGRFVVGSKYTVVY